VADPPAPEPHRTPPRPPGRLRAIERLRGWPGTASRAAWAAAAGFGRHASSQLASAIAYHVLFSLVPLVAVVVSLVDLLLPAEARSDVGEWLHSLVAGTPTISRGVDTTLAAAPSTASLVGLVALAGLIWAAGGMMASIRIAFRTIFEDDRRPFVRGKLLDLVLVAGTGVLAVCAFGLTIVAEVVAELGRRLSTDLGIGAQGRLIGVGTQLAVSLLLAFAVFALLYRTVPPRPPRLDAIWPASALAAVGFHLATTAYGLYLARFARYSAVYGSLGAVLGFLAVVYVGAVVLLFGAELVAAWPAARAGEPRGAGDPPPTSSG
jgi:membrane protein